VLNSTEVGSLFKPGFPGSGEIPAPAGPAHLVTWSPVAWLLQSHDRSPHAPLALYSARSVAALSPVEGERASARCYAPGGNPRRAGPLISNLSIPIRYVLSHWDAPRLHCIATKNRRDRGEAKSYEGPIPSARSSQGVEALAGRGWPRSEEARAVKRRETISRNLPPTSRG